MIVINGKRAHTRIRRIALAAQGLLQDQPFGRGIAGAQKAIQHLGYVQIDSISVVERAHHHVLYSRVPRFSPAMINEMLCAGHIFEYWAHAAAFLPMEDFRYSLPYKQALKSGQTHWYRNPDHTLMNEILARIKSEGPLRSRDFEDRRTKNSGWWDWKPAKKAIEQLYMQGDLMICDRDGFQKAYDLTERVIPSTIDTSTPSSEEQADYLLNQQLRSAAFVTLKGLTYLRRVPGLRDAMKALVADQLDSGKLEQILLENGAEFLCRAGTLENPVPKMKDRVKILSPFDNSVIQRERLQALFEFSYNLECYLPEAKRQYGYFSLPLLYRDTFIGRMDCKAHRKATQLEIKHLHIDPHSFDEQALLKCLAEALRHFARFQGCDTTLITKTTPKYLRRILQDSID